MVNASNHIKSLKVYLDITLTDNKTNASYNMESNINSHIKKRKATLQGRSLYENILISLEIRQSMGACSLGLGVATNDSLTKSSTQSSLSAKSNSNKIKIITHN